MLNSYHFTYSQFSSFNGNSKGGAFGSKAGLYDGIVVGFRDGTVVGLLLGWYTSRNYSRSICRSQISSVHLIQHWCLYLTCTMFICSKYYITVLYGLRSCSYICYSTASYNDSYYRFRSHFLKHTRSSENIQNNEKWLHITYTNNYFFMKCFFIILTHFQLGNKNSNVLDPLLQLSRAILLLIFKWNCFFLYLYMFLIWFFLFIIIFIGVFVSIFNFFAVFLRNFHFFADFFQKLLRKNGEWNSIEMP